MDFDEKLILSIHAAVLAPFLISVYLVETNAPAYFFLALSMLLLAIGYIITLIAGWNGLAKPRYGVALSRRQKLIYFSGIAPFAFALLSSICFLAYSVVLIFPIQ